MFNLTLIIQLLLSIHVQIHLGKVRPGSSNQHSYCSKILQEIIKF